MKKLFLIILISGMFIFNVVAEETGISIDLSGDVTTTFAYNIDGYSFGLDTAARAGLIVNLNNTTDYETESFEDFFGYLRIENLGAVIYKTPFYNSANPADNAWETTSPLYNITTDPVNGTGTEFLNPEIEAKLMLGPVYIKFDNNITLAAERDLAISKMKYLTIHTAAAEYDVTTLDAKQLIEPTGVLSVGYKEELFMIEARVASQNPGRRLTADELSKINSNNGFSFGTELAVTLMKNFELDLGVYASVNYIDLNPGTVEILTGLVSAYIINGDSSTEFLEVTGKRPVSNSNFGNLVDNPLMGGLEASYTFNLNDKLDLVPFIGFELVQHLKYFSVQEFTDGLFEFEIGLGLDLTRPVKLNWDDEPSDDKLVDMGNEFIEWTGVSKPYAESQGVALYAGYVGDFDTPESGSLNIKLTAFDGPGDDSPVPFMGLGFIAVINNILSPDALAGGGGLFVNTDIIDNFIPFFHTNIWFMNSADPAAVVEHVNIVIGGEVSVLKNALLVLKYRSGNFMIPASSFSDKIGDIQVQMKISYN